MKKVIELIPDWREAWKYSSVRWSALGITIMALLEATYQGWLSLPAEVVAMIPNASKIALVLYGLVIAGRILMVVTKVTPDDETPDE